VSIRNQNILIVGGTSGLGFRLGVALSQGNKVIITGRNNPLQAGLEFRFLDLCEGSLSEQLDRFVEDLPSIDILVYAAGHYERGALREMGDEQIIKMNNLYLLAPTLLLARVLKKQERLSSFIALSSVSQWIAKPEESVYCSLKAGFGMLSNCLTLSPGVDKALVVAPARVNKKGQGGAREGENGKLDPDWIIEVILAEHEGIFRYKLLGIARDPAKIEVRDIRLH